MMEHRKIKLLAEKLQGLIPLMGVDPVIQRQQTGVMLGNFRRLMFPCNEDSNDTETLITRVGLDLNHLIRQMGLPGPLAEQITTTMLQKFPLIKLHLRKDAEAAVLGDPAAQDLFEVIRCYPGITALLHHRFAHELYCLKVPTLPRLIAEMAHSETGIDVHPGATIGAGCFFDHGTGIVIGETAVVGSAAKIYQGVTLGAKSFPKDDQGQLIKGAPRHPLVEENVTIYAHATILGRITIGKGAVIGGNVWVTSDVPPGTKIVQTKAHRQSFYGFGDGI